MKKKAMVFSVIFIIASIAAVAAVIFIRGWGIRSSGGGLLTPLADDTRIENVRYYGIKQGRTEWELYSTDALKMRDSSIIALNNVKLINYSEAGGRYEFTSQESTYDEKSGDMTMRGSVRGSSGDGYTLSTELLNYSTRSRTAATDKPVRITSPEADVKGGAMKFELDSDKFMLSNGVRAILKDVSI